MYSSFYNLPKYYQLHSHSSEVFLSCTYHLLKFQLHHHSPTHPVSSTIHNSLIYISPGWPHYNLTWSYISAAPSPTHLCTCWLHHNDEYNVEWLAMSAEPLLMPIMSHLLTSQSQVKVTEICEISTVSFHNKVCTHYLC